MTVAKTALAAQSQMDAPEVAAIVKDIPIPPRPVVVQQMQEEMALPEPDLRRIGTIVGHDVGLTVAVLKIVNSPLFGLSRRADSIEQAVGLIGLNQLSNLVAALALRSMLKGDSQALERFYETSARRTLAMTRMAKTTGVVDSGLAQTFGLFCDVGIPMLMHRFPGYKDTLKVANEDATRSFTAIEQQAHHTDHGLLGAIMARTWGLAPSVCLAIRVHHDYEIFLDPKVPAEVTKLISLNILAEEAIQRYAGVDSSVEWQRGGDYVASTLAMEPAEVQEWVEQLIDVFAGGLE